MRTTPSRGVTRILGAVLVAAVLGALVAVLALAWTSEVTEDRAAEVAEDALAAGGVEADARPPFTKTDYGPRGSEDGPYPVWRIPLDVEGDQITVDVHRDAGQVVFVDDLIGEARGQRLLDDGQWTAVQSYDAPDRWLQRNVLGTVAVGLVVVVGVAVFRRRRSLRGTTGDDASAAA